MLEKDPSLREHPIRVVFVDDDPGVRRLVEILLEFEEYIELVALSGTGKGAIEAVKEHTPDILVIDYRLPDIDGLEVCNKVSVVSPQTQLLVISGIANDEVQGNLKMAGFTYVEKTQAFVDFAGLVRRVVAFGDVIPYQPPNTSFE